MPLAASDDLRRARGLLSVLLPAALALVGLGSGVAEAAVLPAVTQDSPIVAFAGTGVAGYTGDGGPATAARLNQPRDADLGPDGSLVITDTSNHRIRRISPDGTISLVAGTGVAGYSGDGGPATAARIHWPHDVLVDDVGTVYIADSANHCIRRVDLNGTITTFAGTGASGFSGDGGQASQAKLRNPKGLALFENHLYVADGKNDRIRRINLATGIITTVAGSGSRGFSGDGGPATMAALDEPQRIDVDSMGRIYIADSNNDRIRRFTPGGVITTVAGTGASGYSGDGGPATLARIQQPRGVSVAGDDAFYIADTNNHRIRRVDLATGIITTVVGSGSRGYSGNGGQAGDARLFNPRGVTVDSEGRMFVSDTLNNVVRLVTPQVTGPNEPPVALFTSECSGTRCTFDAASSDDPDGNIAGYHWSFGDGSSGSGSLVERNFESDGAFDVTLTVTDNRGESDAITDSVAVSNASPVADFTVSCTGLSCSFNASTSSDSDGQVASYAWDFGDGTGDIGRSLTHDYAAEGTAEVTLVVNDNRGATDQTSQQIAVTPSVETIRFRAAASVGGSSSDRPSVRVPSSVSQGDVLLLFVSNGDSLTPTAPAAWNLVGTRTDANLRSDVFVRSATAADAGSTIEVVLRDSAGAIKSANNTLTLAAYSGVGSPPVIAYAGVGELSSSGAFSHTTPAVAVSASGSMVLSYWADRTSRGTSFTTHWTPPPGQQMRSDAYNTASGGRVTSLLTDDGAVSPLGSRPGVTATADGLAKKATLWTIVLSGA